VIPSLDSDLDFKCPVEFIDMRGTKALFLSLLQALPG